MDEFEEMHDHQGAALAFLQTFSPQDLAQPVPAEPLFVPSETDAPAPSKPKYTEDQLKLMPEWIETSKKMFEVMNDGQRFIGSDKQAASYGLDLMSEFNWNMAGPAGIPGESGISVPGFGVQVYNLMSESAGPDAANGFLNMLDIYADTKTEGATIKRAFRGLAADPLTYATPVGSLYSLGAKAMARKTATTGLRNMLMSTAKAAGFVGEKAMTAPGKTGMAAGAGYGMGFEGGLMGVETAAGDQPTLAEAATRLAVSGTVGSAVGGTFGKALVGGATEAAPAIARGIDQAGQAAEARMAERGKGVTLGMGVDPMAPIDEAIVAISKMTPAKTQDDLVNILNIKAKQMELSPDKRIQPSGQNALFDATPEGYQRTILEQKETPVPRAPEGKALPKGNRAAILIEKADKITDQMAENIRPHLGSKVRYFYHTGPLIDKAKELGVPENVARDQLRKFALNYAATSPRKPTEENLRVASLVSAKEKRGIDYRDIVGPGTGGVSEAGYPMMVNPGGIHAKLIDAVKAGGIDFDTNPKPATFAENVAGNLQGVTADTHAIRGVLDALNKAEPGSIPKEWFGDTIEKQNKLYEAYKKNPAALKPEKDTLPGSLASQKIDGISKQTEYAVISDLYKMTAEKLGITPAEAQALHWFTQGERTGLVSEPKTIIDIIEERIDVTAQALNRPKEEVFVDFFSGKIPLLSLGGLTLLDTGAIIDDQDGEEM